MTADVTLEKGGEDLVKNVQDDNIKQRNGPIEPDESWWAAVLADEPTIVEKNEPVEPIILSKPRPSSSDESSSDESSSSVNWERIEKVFDNDEIVILNVVGYNRGGILVACEDIHGFVPASHLIDLPSELSEDQREQYFTSYLNRKISLKIIECEPQKERIVFSERAALAEEGQRKRLLHSLNVGDIVSGIVTNVTSFGVFVDLGGLEGLIHVSELSWGRVQHPSDLINVDDEVRTQVLQVLEDQGRIALSLKRLFENPWDSLSEAIEPGEIIDAEISCIVKYGAFAKIDGGVEGLIHISSMNFPNDCTHIDEFLYEGQPVKVRVLKIEADKRRLSLKLESYAAR